MDEVFYYLFYVFVTFTIAVGTHITLRELIRHPDMRWERLEAENFRGERIPIVGWVLLLGPAAIMFTAGVLEERHALSWVLATFFFVGFTVLGLIDDAFGTKQIKGLRGHLKVLLKGQVTTGAVKAIGGALGGLGIAYWMTGGVWWKSLLGGALIALCANAFNLLDCRPSRALKGFWLLCLMLIPFVRMHSFLLLAPLIIATLVYAPLDFRCKAMLGDCGSNLLGGVLGTFIVQKTPLPFQIGLTLLLIAFHTYAEKRSLSADIERISWLRFVDRLGVKG